MKKNITKHSSLQLLLKNISAGRKALWNRILILCGSALALYQFISTLMEQKNIANLLASIPYFDQYINPVISNVLYYLAAAIIIAFLRQSSFTSYSKKVKGTDIEIGVKVGNIFNTSDGIIVPSNNTFIHDVNIIGTKSIQAQIAQKCQDGVFTSEIPVEEQLSRFLNTNQQLTDQKISLTPIVIDGKSYEQYEYGSVVPITLNEGKKVKNFYFLSMSMINLPQIPVTSDMDLAKSITAMWKNVNDLATETSISAPVIATGAAHFFDIPAEVVARYILKSFANYACSKNVRINKFTLIINPNDYLANKYDLEQLHTFIDYLCDFPYNETEIIKEHQQNKLQNNG